MKNFIIFILISVCLFAQKPDFVKLYPNSFGASVYMKAGTNAVVQESNRQTKFGIKAIPDFYLNAYLPYSIDKNIGLYIETGLNNNGYIFKFFETQDEYTTTISYFSIAPYIYLEGFLFGFSFGIPLHADFGRNGENVFTDNSYQNRLNNVFELRLGGTYNLYKDDNGRIAINLLFSYTLNGVYKDYIKNEPYQELIPQADNYPLIESSNPRLANINIGFLYFFNFIY